MKQDRMMRRSLLFLSLLLLGALCLFFACDGEGDPVETGNSTDEVSGTVSGTEDPNGDSTVYELASKTTSAKIELRDGQPYITSLKTESGVEKAGEPVPFNLPSLGKDVLWTHTSTDTYDDGDGGVGYIFRFKNDDLQVTYDLYAVARPDMAGPFEFFGYVTNGGEAVYSYKPGSYFGFCLTSDVVPTAWTFVKESGVAEGWTIYDGQGFGGTGIKKTKLSYLNGVTCGNWVDQNWNDNGNIPMIYLDYGTDGVYYAMEWSNGKLAANNGGEGILLSASLLGGRTLSTSFATEIPAGESVYMPSVYLGVYDGDVDVGSNIFKHWFLRFKAPDNLLENPNEPLTQQDMQLGYDVAQYGIQAIKWDYGWWSNTLVDPGKTMWRTNEGLLEVNNSSYLGVLRGAGCETIAEFAQKALDEGVTLTLYHLLKDTKLDREGVPTSVGPYGHPEWFSDICITGVGNSADLGNKECVAFFQKYMEDFFVANHITTWRSDFEPICRSSNQENRHRAAGADVQYWCTVGFGELVDYLIDNVEGFRYESCSSGGSMKDFFTATKASVINCDDSADFMSLHMSFYDASYCFHPAQLQLPTNALTYTPGSPYYAGIGDYLYGFRCTLTGAVMLGSWGGPTAEDISYWPHYIDNLYNTVMKPLIKYGDLYHILPRPDGVHWDGLQYIDLDSENEIIGMVLLWKPTDTEGPQKTVKLRGLDADASYQLTFEDRPEQNAVYTGAELMDNGLTVTIEGDFGSEMIWISHAQS